MIIQGCTDSFRSELLQGIHNFASDVIKIALYQDGASTSLIPSLTAYGGTGGELVATGYTAGGGVLAGQSVSSQPGVAWVNWNNLSFNIPQGTSVDGALIYNSSKANRSVAVLNFGISQLASSSGVFTITFPTSPSINAILRIS